MARRCTVNEPICMLENLLGAHALRAPSTDHCLLQYLFNLMQNPSVPDKECTVFICCIRVLPPAVCNEITF
jgi:hypothetical protein